MAISRGGKMNTLNECRATAEVWIDEIFEKGYFKEELIEEVLKILVGLREYIEDKEWDLEFEIKESEG